MERPVHNTNSPNFVKLDYEDLSNILALFGEQDCEDCLTSSERVTYERVTRIRDLMIQKRGKDDTNAANSIGPQSR
jgi:uncharacterized protein YjcR